MARKQKVLDLGTTRYGIKVTDTTGRVGWIVGQDGDYLLFESEDDAAKALKKMKRDDRYSWNCRAEAVRFDG